MGLRCRHSASRGRPVSPLSSLGSRMGNFPQRALLYLGVELRFSQGMFLLSTNSEWTCGPQGCLRGVRRGCEQHRGCRWGELPLRRPLCHGFPRPCPRIWQDLRHCTHGFFIMALLISRLRCMCLHAGHLTGTRSPRQAVAAALAH